MEGWRYNSTWALDGDEWLGLHHARFTPYDTVLVPIGYEAGWAEQAVRTL
jgi:hypothetical protein